MPRKWITVGATALTGLGVLLSGLFPPYVLATGQLDPRAWFVPILCGAILLAVVLRWSLREWRWGIVGPAMLCLFLPPLVLCLTGSMGQAGRLTTWMQPVASLSVGSTVPEAEEGMRPAIGILSGPTLYGPAPGGPMAGFALSPLWEILGSRFRIMPFAALDAAGLSQVSGVLLVQPRALSPEELVALDGWIRRGGRAVLLADPDLRWADARPLGHPLRPPLTSLLDPLLNHWGLALAPVRREIGVDPVERRFLDRQDGGRMIQLAGASHFLPTGSGLLGDLPVSNGGNSPDGGRPCALSSGGLIARCALGKGRAILVADADFANEALWTADPRKPGDTSLWTSDAVPALVEWLGPKTGEQLGRRVWLARADGLSGALRWGLLTLLLGVLVTLLGIIRIRTNQEL